MDDKSRHGKGLHISVYAFYTKDVDKLMFTLQDKFNIKCSIHYMYIFIYIFIFIFIFIYIYKKDHKPRFYILKESMDIFKSLISPYWIKKCYISWVYC